MSLLLKELDFGAQGKIYHCHLLPRCMYLSQVVKLNAIRCMYHFCYSKSDQGRTSHSLVVFLRHFGCSTVRSLIYIFNRWTYAVQWFGGDTSR